MRISIAILIFALIICAGLLATTGGSRADEPPNPRIVEPASSLARPADRTGKQIVVRFKPSASAAAIAALNGKNGAKLLKEQPASGLQRLAPEAGASLEGLLAAYRRSPLVAEANVAHIAQLLDTPNDTNYSYQWHLRATEGGMWADLAWDLAPNRGQGVVVAVIDTGVAYEDFNSQLGGAPQTFHIAPDLATTPFVAPWDFNNNDAHPNDDHGHGSHVAGTISQDTNNAYGVAGVARNSTVMPLKVLDYTGNGFDDDIVEAIYHAVNNGTDVINMSLGFPGTGGPDANGVACTEIAGLNTALDYAHDNGVVLVAAAGNDGGIVSCPAAHPQVISVGATRFDGQVTFYSNNGSALDISAPGGDPYVDQNGDGYGDGVLQESFCYDASILLQFNLYGSFCNVFQSGTSMASPHVAGTAALLLGENPALTPDEVRSYLETTARDYGTAGWDGSYGWGALDAAGALSSLLGVPKPTPTPFPGLDAPTNLTATAVSTSRINLAWTDNATNETGYKVERSTDSVNFTQVALLVANTTSYPNQTLTAATTYHYRVRAHNGNVHSAFSNTASATTQPAPDAPTNLTAVAVSSSRVNLAWTDNANNEGGFKIERSTDNVTFSQIAILGPNTTSTAIANLPASTLYYFRVRAYEGTNNSGYTNVASATTQATPAAPSNLSATAVSTSQVNLAWTDNATSEGGFKVERSTDGVTFSQVAMLLANTTSWPNSSLAAATTYHYRVRAYDGPNNSAFTNTAVATTQGAPAAPSNLSATAVSSSQINLAWTDNAANEAGFKLERSTDNVTFIAVATLVANTTSYSNPSLAASTTYWYRIRAYEGTNNSAYSNTASATTQSPPAAPSNLTATAVSSSRINLTWTDNSSSEAGFKLDRSTDGVAFTQIAILTKNVVSFANTNLPSSTAYWYRIRSYDGANHSAYSNVASATTQATPAAPTNLTATALNNNRIRLNWTDNATNEGGFRLERSTDGVNFTLLGIFGANTTTFTNAGLTSGVTYYYRVRAYEGPNNSAYTNVAFATAAK